MKWLWFDNHPIECQMTDIYRVEQKKGRGLSGRGTSDPCSQSASPCRVL